jgi:hypothetical protein
MRVFFILAVIFSCGSLQALTRTKTFYPISCRGSLYLPPGNSEVPTTIWLSTLGVGPGTILGITQVGTFQYYPGSVPEWSTALVFVDQNGNYLHPGPRSIAYDISFTFPDVYGDVGIASNPQGYQYGIEIPEGAVALLVAPTDPFTLDNVDTDGDYGIEIEIPYHFPFEVAVQQNGSTNLDVNGDGIIDIRPTEFANIVAYLTPYTNAAQSTLLWHNDTSGSELTAIYPNLPISGPGRDLVFPVNNVPGTLEYLGMTTITITLRDADGVFMSEKTLHVNVLPSSNSILYKIFQVVENPKFNESTNVVDLVAGKNADVIVTVNPNIDVQNSRINWLGGSYLPKQNNSGAEGKVIFEINPVPTNLTGLSTMNIQIKDSANLITAERNASVHVWQTKTMKIGFLSISSPFGVYPPPPHSEVATFVKDGCQITGALFPVSNSNFSCDETNIINNTLSGYLNLIPTFSDGDGYPPEKTIGASTIYADNYSLEKAYLSLAQTKGFDYLIGVANEEYFRYHHNEFEMLGQSYCNLIEVALNIYDCGNTAIVRVDSPIPMAHELGHLFGLSHSPGFTEASDGYSNQPLPNFGIPRGPRGSRFVLMEEGGGYTGTVSGVWTSSEEYLTLLRRSLIDNSEKTKIEAVNLKLDGIIINGKYILMNSYITSSFSTPPGTSGRYLLEVTDVEGAVLTTLNTNSSIEGETTIEGLSAKINILPSAMFVNIYDTLNNGKVLIGRVTIPADLLLEEVKYVPQAAVEGEVNAIQDNFRDLINLFRANLNEKNLFEAKKTLEDRILPFIERNFKANYIPQSILEAGSSTLNNVSLQSLIRLTASQNTSNDSTNSFFALNQANVPVLGGRSKLAISRASKPIGNESEIIYRAWFDGFELPVSKSLTGGATESLILSRGVHQWAVQAFLVNSRMFRSLNAGIEKFRLTNYNLQLELEKESDPEKRNQIIMTVTANTRKIELMKAEIENLMQRLGNPVILSFEVL